MVCNFFKVGGQSCNEFLSNEADHLLRKSLAEKEDRKWRRRSRFRGGDRVRVEELESGPRDFHAVSSPRSSESAVCGGFACERTETSTAKRVCLFVLLWMVSKSLHLDLRRMRRLRLRNWLLQRGELYRPKLQQMLAS
ncbi:hypothetical protein EUGRSUZ_B02054 [Eucalyptus grandis]|uniref:Uncharacterized protein n=2 Tax=Eucalyptus grandis TaxID=71139 RepID=A0ACC3M2D4_EUCGR|nr:hypothetical protein EUGRSUZ_B02054 [Eucalyptus grandis]